MATLGENFVSQFLQSKDLNPIKIPEGAIQTPDYKVHSLDDNLLFYLEEKTIENDNFLDEVEPGIIVDGNDPSENSLEKKFRKAAKQFRSVNESHTIPNVLAFFNQNPMVNIHDLYITLTGNALTDEGKILPLRPVGRIVNDLKDIDLCLWFGEDGQLRNVIWINEQFKTLMSNLLKI